ncbi:SPX domain-containing protein 4 [Vitis vinifera]|uniref:SPX domain-containing protein 4 n=1 Tax=Vitis vinifera TaxID=29760 RepID=A0A438H8L5_VITVI|nr:SPX domain-containing protein 4 [Vitis vinifera]
MKFGKEFRTHLEETLPEWRDKFLCYKPLKKLLKTIPTAADSLPPPHDFRLLEGSADVDDVHGHHENRPLMDLQECSFGFSTKSSRSSTISTLTRRKSSLFVYRFPSFPGNLNQTLQRLQGYPKNRTITNFSFTQLALNQPFFTTEPLTRLVRECEANLELLFPLEAEVIESTPTLRNQTNQLLNDLPNLSSDTPSSLGEETGDIYRSTLAAMKAIRGLRKASSTCNPLSFASFFGNQDDESAGAVTAENSASNSLATLQSGEEADQEDANSRKQN